MYPLSRFFCLVAVAMLALPLSVPARAQMAGPYDWAAAVMRVTPAKIGSAYVRVDNPTPHNDVLQSAQAPWADRIELHEVTTDKDGIMAMHKIDGMALPAKGAMILKNGGYHLMIFGIKDDLKVGDKKNITLQFQKAGALTVPFTVKPLGNASAAPPHHMHHDMDDMPGM